MFFEIAFQKIFFLTTENNNFEKNKNTFVKRLMVVIVHIFDKNFGCPISYPMETNIWETLKTLIKIKGFESSKS